MPVSSRDDTEWAVCARPTTPSRRIRRRSTTCPAASSPTKLQRFFAKLHVDNPDILHVASPMLEASAGHSINRGQLKPCPLNLLRQPRQR